MRTNYWCDLVKITFLTPDKHDSAIIVASDCFGPLVSAIVTHEALRILDPNSQIVGPVFGADPNPDGAQNGDGGERLVYAHHHVCCDFGQLTGRVMSMIGYGHRDSETET